MTDVVQVIPSAETVAVRWLKDHPNLSMVNSRVYPESPSQVIYPFIRIERVAGVAGEYHWLDKPVVQVSAWAQDTVGGLFGSARIAAREICAAAIAALHELPGQTDMTDEELGAVITDVADVIGPRSVPDPVAKCPRFIGEVEMTLHPLKDIGS